MRGGASPIDMVEVTAADRAAAPVRGGGEPLRPLVAGASPFRGGFVRGNAAKRLPPQRELSEVPYSAYGIGKSLERP